MSGPEAGSVAQALDGVAGTLPDVERVEVEGTIEYRRGGRVFAVVTGPTAAFRLRPEIARAAVQTPDADPSPRGPGWVSFAPIDADGFALDRAAAWFESAWRLAAA
ncbi:MAG TPA: hypothetical protein VF763_04035 [Candidatus Limnocylindrales bacterium]